MCPNFLCTLEQPWMQHEVGISTSDCRRGLPEPSLSGRQNHVNAAKYLPFSLVVILILCRALAPGYLNNICCVMDLHFVPWRVKLWNRLYRMTPSANLVQLLSLFERWLTIAIFLFSLEEYIRFGLFNRSPVNRHLRSKVWV